MQNLSWKFNFINFFFVLLVLYEINNFFSIKRFFRIWVFEAEVESRTQPSRPRIRKKSEAKAKDRLFEDRPSRGQGQEWSRPRTEDTIFQNYGRQIFHYFLTQSL